MTNDDTTRRMDTVLRINGGWEALGGAVDDPAHSAWLEQATLWAVGRRAELPPHPTLTVDGEQSNDSPRRFTRRASAYPRPRAVE